MTPVSEIFELQIVCDDPRFEGFGVSQPSFLGRTARQSLGEPDLANDFNPPLPIRWDWSPPTLLPTWRSKDVLPRGRVSPFNDFPCINMQIPAFSAKAVSSLEDLLVANGELLPFYFEEREYFAYNCQTVVDALDYEAIYGRPVKARDTMTSLHRYEFIQDKVQGLSIFKIREFFGRVFVSNVFVDRVVKSDLCGFDFVKIWPLPPGVDYFKAHYDGIKHNKEIGFWNGLPIKGQSIGIEFHPMDTKLSKEEKSKIAQIEDELDAHLMVRSTDPKYYFGCLESKRTVKGVVKLYFSCPNAERLFEKLRPWLQTIEQPSKPKVFLKKVPYDHVPADQIEVFP